MKISGNEVGVFQMHRLSKRSVRCKVCFIEGPKSLNVFGVGKGRTQSSAYISAIQDLKYKDRFGSGSKGRGNE